MEHVLYESIFDLWEKTKIESNQLYITDEQEKEASENIKKCNREKRKKEREIRIGLKILSFSLILDQIHFLMYSTKHSQFIKSTKHSHSIIDTFIYTIIRSL